MTTNRKIVLKLVGRVARRGPGGQWRGEGDAREDGRAECEQEADRAAAHAEQGDDDGEDAAHQTDPEDEEGELAEDDAGRAQGVAAIAWNVRTHLKPAMIGNIASPEAVCIAVAASSPGAMNPRYDDAGQRPAGGRAVDDATEAEAHRGEEQDGLEERAEDARPAGPPVADEVELEDMQGRPEDAGLTGPARRHRRHRAQSTRLRPGQAQEDVFERAPADEHALRPEAPLVDGDGRGLAVVGVEQDPVGQASRRSMRSSTSASSSASSVSWIAGREAQLDDLAGGVALDELARRALGHDLRLVHDDEPVAQLLGLVHVVGRQHEGDARAA